MPRTSGSRPASPSSSARRPAVASVHVMGGAPGTRETDLLAPEQTVEAIDAVVLAGGSAFGLDAAAAVMAGPRGGRARLLAVGASRCRSSRPRSSSISSTAATRTGATRRPMRGSAPRRWRRPAPTSPSAPPAPAPARPPPTSRAASARPRRGSKTARRSRRSSRSTPSARRPWATARISGRRRSRWTASSAGSAGRPVPRRRPASPPQGPGPAAREHDDRASSPPTRR